MKTFPIKLKQIIFDKLNRLYGLDNEGEVWVLLQEGQTAGYGKVYKETVWVPVIMEAQARG